MELTLLIGMQSNAHPEEENGSIHFQVSELLLHTRSSHIYHLPFAFQYFLTRKN